MCILCKRPLCTRRGYRTFVAGVDAWYNEERMYNYAGGGFSSATGHFTQMVWRDSTKLGCGYNTRCGMATYVCNYSPQGEQRGFTCGAVLVGPGLGWWPRLLHTEYSRVRGGV
jgi:hypothetical protein